MSSTPKCIWLLLSAALFFFVFFFFIVYRFWSIKKAIDLPCLPYLQHKILIQHRNKSIRNQSAHRHTHIDFVHILRIEAFFDTVFKWTCWLCTHLIRFLVLTLKQTCTRQPTSMDQTYWPNNVSTRKCICNVKSTTFVLAVRFEFVIRCCWQSINCVLCIVHTQPCWLMIHFTVHEGTK